MADVPGERRRPRALVVATMFPNPAQPVFGTFVQRRVEHVAALADVTVLAPIPWFPFGTRLARYAVRARIPAEGEGKGYRIHYPRFLSIPRFAKWLDGWFMALALRRYLARHQEIARPDLVDAHLAFPDGAGARHLARWLGVPFTVTLRGHDINDLPQYRMRRLAIQKVLRDAARVMSVADALRQGAVALGCDAAKTETIPNGVTENFRLGDQAAARAKLGLPKGKRIVISVGHLVERKGHHLIVEALGILRDAKRHDAMVVFVGAGSEEGNYEPVIRGTVARLGLEDRVVFAGAQLNETLPDWYTAADMLCLASSKEGWANVLLESLGCGRPVVATRVWGTPEVISGPHLGVLVDRTATDIARGLDEAMSRPWDEGAISAYARGFTWPRAAERVVNNYRLALGRA